MFGVSLVTFYVNCNIISKTKQMYYKNIFNGDFFNENKRGAFKEYLK